MTAQPADQPTTTKRMDDIVALCRRRGFIFQSSEIYGGINGFWDYGPLGAALKRNLKNAWWHDIINCPPDGADGQPLSIVPLDSTIIMHPKVWEASGHVAGFNDPMVDCRVCKSRFRADHVSEILLESAWGKSLWEVIEGIEIPSDEAETKSDRWVKNKGKKLAPGLAVIRGEHKVLDGGVLDAIAQVHANPNSEFVPPYCPNCGGDLTEPRAFNLMFQTYIGATATEDDKAYLRPETAQGIFTEFWNVVDSSRVKVPFGIAQQGKAFRNEVTPRNFTFRSREFEQMEIEFFIHPSEADQWYAYWRDSRFAWWKSIGLAGENLILREHDKDELAHYAKNGAGTSDVEYRFPFTSPGYGELEGIAHRADFDLKAHAEMCGKGEKMRYFDQQRNEHYFPHVIEPSAGADRGTLAVLCEAYTPDESRASKVYMNFNPRLAPIKAAIFPLVNKDGMPEMAEKLYRQLRTKYAVQTDAKQSIGKRYARMDEAGTPYCFTIDSDSLTDQTVTVRHRDTQEQERIAIDKVEAFLAEKIGG